MNGLHSWFRLVITLIVIQFGLSIPHHHYQEAHDDLYTNKIPGNVQRSFMSKRVDDFYLRIMPLGASITLGLHSSDLNGYRKGLRDQLRWDGWNVNMVGTKSGGTMNDKQFEATSGWRVDQVLSDVESDIDFQPNVVLINAGTNDCSQPCGREGQSYDPPTVRDHMRDLVNYLFDNIPGTTIVLSGLLANGATCVQACSVEVNGYYQELVKTMQAENKKIVYVDTQAKDSTGQLFLDPEFDFYDETHPNDEGYQKLAYLFWTGINDANDKGFLSAPAIGIDDSAVADSTCKKTFGSGESYYYAETQKGSGAGDGNYIHDSEKMGVKLTISGDENDMGNFSFARLYSNDYHDILKWTKPDDAVRYQVWRNKGAATWEKVAKAYVDVDDNCNPGGVRWADANGDGVDDFFCIDLSGNVFVSINDGTEGNTVPKFHRIGQWNDFTPPSPYGGSQHLIHIFDIDGDGRADYCAASGTGDIMCWRNGGIEDAPEYWQPLGVRRTGQNMGDIDGLRFADVNGDGRDDWIWLDTTGQGWVATNSRDCATGEEGNGLAVNWRNGRNINQADGGWTYGGMSLEGARDGVHIAKAYGDPQDFGLLGRADYIHITRGPKKTETALGVPRTSYDYDFTVWKSKGSGGTKQKADGDRYCNMMGWPDGRMDYVWILSKGKMTLYANTGTMNSPMWKQPVDLWDSNNRPSPETNRILNRRDLYLADFNGDGVCDIIYVPDGGGTMEVWINNIRNSADGTDFGWKYIADAAPQVTCDQKHGVGLFDQAVHWADIDGNGWSDFVCMEPDGRSKGWLHHGVDDWEEISQYKFSEGLDRANHRFADVNGDRRADFIHINKFNGDARVWYNIKRGTVTTDSSAFRWDVEDSHASAYEGPAQGACMHFPDLNGDGRADFHFTRADTNIADSWLNICSGTGGGDDGPVVDPNLPVLVTDDWRSITCEDLKNKDENARQKWVDGKCEVAWTEVTTNYLNGFDVDTNKIMSESIANDLPGIGGASSGSDFICGMVDNDDWCSSKQCGVGVTGCSDLIWNSFSALNVFLHNLHDSTLDAANWVDIYGNISDTFAPKPNDAIDLVLDMLSLTFEVVSVPAFKLVLSGIMNEAAKETMKEVFSNIVSGAVSIASDAKAFFDNPDDVSLTGLMKQNALRIADSYLNLSKKIFVDAPYNQPVQNRTDGIQMLHSLISTGIWVQEGFIPPSKGDITKSMAQSYTAMMIWMAWKLGPSGYVPLIIDPVIDCDTDFPTGEFYDPLVMKDLKVCIDGRAYYVVGRTGNVYSKFCDGFVCTDRHGQFQELPGYSELVAGGEWLHGLTLEMLVRAAINTESMYGNSPDESQLASVTSIGSMLELAEFGSPGMVQIPICSMASAESAWSSGLPTGCPTY